MTSQPALALDKPCTLKDVLLSEALTIRPSRPPRGSSESWALRQLIQQMADDPEPMVQKLVDLALEICLAGSAGVSLLDKTENGEEIFRWVALAGAASKYRGGTTPAHWSPCGTCLARGLPTLFSYPARYFTYFNDVPLQIVEGLVVPLRARGRDIGTIWVMHHSVERRFDAEDARILENLGSLTAATLLLQEARKKAERGKQQAELATLKAEIQARALAESEERFRALFGKSAIGMLCTDPAGVILQANDSYCEITGYRREELLATDFRKIVHPDDVKTNLRKTKRLLAGKIQNFVVEERYRRRSGTVAWVRSSVSLARGAADHPANIIVICEDITKRKEVENQLYKTHRQLEKNAIELRRSNDDLAQFAFVASHDLKSPLRTVLLYTELLQRDHKDQLVPEAQGYLRLVADRANRMTVLIDDLLRYSRLTTEDVAIEGLIDAGLIVDESIEFLKDSILAAGGLVTHAALPMIKVNPSLFSHLFQNLIANAINYRGIEKPQVYISAKRTDTQWVFSVRDNGIGIDAQYWETIFEPFKRLHGEDRPGSGIGLALCKKLVERAGGKIWVQSKIEEGSTFYFSVPL